MSYIGNPIISTDFPKDTFSGNNSTTAFTMSVAPASVNAVVVVVSGVVQDPSTYTISGTTLTFSAAPPTGTSNISVRHLGVAGVPNTPSAASVGTSSLIDASVTQAKLASGVASTGPAFAVNNNANQSVSANTEVVAQFQTEQFDTASCFNNTGSTVGGIPAYSFLPNVAGYYTFSATIRMQSCTGTNYGGFWKNGSRYNVGWYTDITPSNGQIVTFSATIYLNGTTDYVQVFAYLAGSGSQNINYNNATSSCLFSGCLVRAA